MVVMFDNYDNIEKLYEIVFSNTRKIQYTTKELYEFFIFTETNIGGSFEDLKSRLDSGFCIGGDDIEWDWTSGSHIKRGRLYITRFAPPKIPSSYSKENNSSNCKHKNKYINQAGGIRFWVCPSCKKDLGDA